MGCQQKDESLGCSCCPSYQGPMLNGSLGMTDVFFLNKRNKGKDRKRCVYAVYSFRSIDIYLHHNIV